MCLGEGINAICASSKALGWQLVSPTLLPRSCDQTESSKWASKARSSLTARWRLGRAQFYLLWSVYNHIDWMSQKLQTTFHFAFPKQKRTEQPIGLNYPHCQYRKRVKTEAWVYRSIMHQDYTQTYKYSYSNYMNSYHCNSAKMNLEFILYQYDNWQDLIFPLKLLTLIVDVLILQNHPCLALNPGVFSLCQTTDVLVY